MVASSVLLQTVLDLRRFYAQEVFTGIGAAIARKRFVVKAVFFIITIGRRSFIFNYTLLFGILLFSRLFKYPKKDSFIFQYAATRNNVIALKKLNGCLPQNIIDGISLNFRSASVLDRLVAGLSFRSVARAASALRRNHHVDPLVHLRCSIGAAACVLYARRPVPNSVRVLCVASDHSPVCRALISLFGSQGKKTCYVQHAPVTKHFPPLSTDLSVLYDEKSVDAYRLSAERAGVPFDARIVLMPPFIESFQRPAVKAGPVRVGVCLSRLPKMKELRRVLYDIAAVDNVASIVLRRHPACRLNISSLLSILKVSEQVSGDSLSQFSQCIDLALVPNSGVAIELLHAGVPTFYCKGVDDVPEDYYGFVSDGVLPVFDGRIFDGYSTTAHFFNEDWGARFSKYDVTVYRRVDECRSDVAVEFGRLLSSTIPDSDGFSRNVV